MEIKHTKPISIYSLFLRHLIGLSLSIILLITLFIVAIFFLLQYQALLPANHTDTQINQLEHELANSFAPELLSSFSTYLIVDDYGIIQTNMSEQSISKTKKFLSKGTKLYYDCFKIIEQTDGNIIIIKYDMMAHFSNATLHKLMPYPELMALVGLFALIILLSVITAKKFSKKLKQNLSPIIRATEKIENQDLDFHIELTKIREINTALDAIDGLKSALSASLKEQWHDQQQKKSQIAALAHDIKTPLTVIKGNTDLLIEDNTQGGELLNDIKISTDNIEQYVQLLMRVVVDQCLNVQKESLTLADFLPTMTREATALCSTKSIAFIPNYTASCKTICADSALLKRALMNMVDNAVRYSPVDGKIHFLVSETDGFVTCHIMDSGKGFTPDSLENATQEFYTEESSRFNNHYGLGLNFVKNVAAIHGGTLEIKNLKDTHGAHVSLSLAKNSCPSSTVEHG